MGTSRNAAQFVRKMHLAGEATDRHRKQAVTAGAVAAKNAMIAAAGAKGVPLGGKIAGRTWNVRFDVKGADPEALVRYTGPFHLVNNPTKPHYIAAKGLGGTRASRGDAAFQASAANFLGGSARGSFASRRRSKGKRAIVINGQPRAYAFHPGTKGKNILPAARAAAGVTVPPAMAESMRGAWKRVLT